MKILEFDTAEDFNKYFENKKNKFKIYDIKIGFSDGKLRKVYVLMI
jgi:hypothetical protein